MTDAAVPALSEAAAALDRWQARGRLPRLDELPIPADVRPGPGWTQQMTEMADHIGAYTTLCIVARYGGTQVYIGRDPARSPFAEVVDAATAAAIADIYGGNRLLVPVGRVAIARARRAVVLAAVRAKRISGADAAKVLGTSRTYLSPLLNETDEGCAMEPAAAVSRFPRQGDLFALLTDPRCDRRA